MANMRSHRTNINHDIQVNNKNLKKQFIKKVEPFLYLAPALVLLFLFTYYPFLKTIFNSFFSLNSQAVRGEFIGFDNYASVLRNPTFYQSILNSFIYAFTTVPISIVIALFLAIHSKNKTKSSSFYEMMFALTMAMSVSVVAMIFKLMYNPTFGLLNDWLGTNIRWLTDANYALLSIIIVGTWIDIGYNYLFLLSAIRGISGDVLERSALDGTSGWRKITKIIIPLISPTLFFLITNQLAKKLMEVSLVLILTNGGPSGASETMISFMYKQSINNLNYNNGFAAAIISFFVTLVLMAINFYYERKGVFYQ